MTLYVFQDLATYRWYCPDAGPAATPERLADWAAIVLPDEGAVRCGARDLDVMRARFGERVSLPALGVVQAGTLWLEIAHGA